MREGDISHYHLLEKLGEGAMGEVYRAEDTRLKRTVALKFLPDEMVADASLRQRFLHEAQAAAALDHPNICTIHEIDEREGEIFLAMAFIDGPTLQNKISQRPLKLEEAVEIAIQTGEGLEAAHERGIVHRDIKSSNILLTSKGQAKITDFGLAILGGQTRLTQAGAIVGTPGYMSPEQARGEAADARSDLWSLGVVLYEMVSGQLPFGGESAQAAVFAILHKEPEPLTALRAGVPLEMDRIVAKALAKNAGQRYQHATDILVDLRSVKKLLESRPQAIMAEREPPAREAVTIGQTLGHFQLEEKLGEGGMGIVFRALDTHLGRPVAIKVLKPGKAGAEQKKRFVLEAKAASALNHPNIVHIYDIAESGGVDYIAMEFVEGATLDRLIPPKGMQLNDALRMAVSIADALGKAHAAGIVHRDLKPSNIMAQPDGVVKVLDFGLAKLLEAGAGSAIPPEERPQSDEGTIMGTLAYMSPEQAQGSVVDSRSDIFSFGAVLYEMVTGRRAFQGPSRASTMAALLAQEPTAPGAVVAGLPLELESAILRCLRKDPRRRWQSFTDLKVVLEDLKEESDSGRLGRAGPGPAKRRRWLLAAGFATLAVLATIGAAVWMLRGHQTTARHRAEWQQLTNFTDSATQPALSPDGRILSFVRGPGTFYTPGQIYVKLLPDGEPVQLTHDNRSKMSPIFTPDGSRIAYTVAFPWDTWIVPVLGGEPRLMLANASGLHWIGPDRVLFSEIKSGAHMALVTSRESRTEERDVYVPPHEGGMAHRSAISPDGKLVLLVEMENSVWLPCRVAPFDGSSSGRRVGPQPGACTDADWSPDGKWMYLASESNGKFHIWRQRLGGGAPEQITSGPNEEQGIAIAPDGQSLITSVGQTQSEIWFHEASGERQVSSQGFATAPFLSADGKRIYYILRKTAEDSVEVGGIWMWEIDSNHSEHLLPGIVIGSFDVSPDNKRLLYSVVKPDLKSEIWLAALDRRFPPRRLSSGDDSSPRFRPDGNIMFMSSEGKMNHLYRMRGDGTGRQRVSESPILGLGRVSPDGKWAFVWGTVPEEESPNALLLFPTDGGASVRICDRCSVEWAPDGKYFYIQLGGGMSQGIARTYAIPLRRGSMAPALPPAGVKSPDDLKDLPGVQIIDVGLIAPGMSPSTYAFTKTSVHRNLYRVLLL